MEKMGELESGNPDDGLADLPSSNAPEIIKKEGTLTLAAVSTTKENAYSLFGISP